MRLPKIKLPLPKDTTSKEYVNSSLRLELQVVKKLLKQEEKGKKVKNGT